MIARVSFFFTSAPDSAIIREALIKTTCAAWRANWPSIKGENRRNTLCISRFSQRRVTDNWPAGRARGFIQRFLILYREEEFFKDDFTAGQSHPRTAKKRLTFRSACAIVTTAVWRGSVFPALKRHLTAAMNRWCSSVGRAADS